MFNHPLLYRVSIALSILIASALTPAAQSQTFNAHMAPGLNYAQISGDGLRGLNRSGLHLSGGLTLNSPNKWEPSLELVYNEKGSAKRFSLFPKKEAEGIRLQYVEIPILISFKDWWDDGREFHRMRFSAGLSYSRLLKSEVNNLDLQPGGTPEELEEKFTRNSFFWLIGASVYFHPSVSFQLRYQRGINLLFNSNNHPDIDTGSLLESSLTFRLAYHL